MVQIETCEANLINQLKKIPVCIFIFLFVFLSARLTNNEYNI